MYPSFLHIDMDAFFASVEQNDHPELKGRPVVVGSPPDQRGVVSAASYEARKFGIRSAMPSRTAYQKCPDAVFLPVNMARYQEVSRRIMKIFESFTPFIQPLSIDEAFLEISGAQRLFGSAREIAEKIRFTIREQTGLTASAGVAPNMFLAKLASDMNKPNGQTVVPDDPEAIEAFLAPLSIDRMWGIGKVTQKKLRTLGINTIGKLRECDPRLLEHAIGPHSTAVFLRLARGIDNRRIEMETQEKSISNEITFKEDTSDRKIIEAAYKQLMDKVGSRLRKAGFYAGSVHLKIRWSDFSTITRQITLPQPCNDDITLRKNGLDLLTQNWTARPVRLIGFGVGNLSATDKPHSAQLDLFNLPDTELHEKRKRLSQTTDQIRQKYGNNSLRRGSSLDNA